MSLRQRRILVPIVALVVTAAALAAYPKRSKSKAETAAEAVRAASLAAVPIVKPRINVWIQGDGIRPSTIHAMPGINVLTVENDTAVALNLTVAQILPDQSKVDLGMLAVSARHRKSGEFIFNVGNYVLYEKTHPGLKQSRVSSGQN